MNASRWSSSLSLGLIVAALTSGMGCGPPYQMIRQATPNPFVGAQQFAMLPVTWDGVMVGRITEGEYLGRNPRRAENYMAAKPIFGTSLVGALTRRSPGLQILEAGMPVAMMMVPAMPPPGAQPMPAAQPAQPPGAQPAQPPGAQQAPPPNGPGAQPPGAPPVMVMAPQGGLPPPPAGLFLIHVNVTNFEPGYSIMGISHNAEASMRVQVMSPTGQVLDELEVDSQAAVNNGGYGANRIEIRMLDLGNSAGRKIARYLRDRTAAAPPPHH